MTAKRLEVRTPAPSRRWLPATAGVVAGWAVIVWLTGGIRYAPFGIRISSTDARRPFLLALIVFAAYLWRSAATVKEGLGRLASPRGAHTAAIVISVAMFAIAMIRGITVAGSADAYGYVSQAALWRHGTLALPVDMARQVPWPHAISTLAPLGYRPSSNIRDHIVPVYAAGLPLAMAFFQLLIGYSGAFLVVPLSGAVAVWLAFLLGRRLFNSANIGIAAAILVATSPAFLFQVFWPMSDVPVATAWTAALVLLVYDWPLAAGLAMSVTLAIRPNLILLPVSALLWTAALDYRDRRLSGRSLRVALGILPGVAGIALLQWQVYGSPLESGYGSLDSLFAVSYATENIVRYPTWLIQTQTPLVLLGVVVLLVPRWWTTRVPLAWLLCGGTLVATFATYLFYMPFEPWWYLRFLLPAWAVGMTLAVGGWAALLQRFAPRFRTVTIWVVVVAVAVNGLRFARNKAVFDLGRSERRYVDVANFIDRHTERNAVILAMQHSGSIRQYAGRLTLRYDSLPPAWLDRSADYLESIGRHPYLALEGWEVTLFKQRFAAYSERGALNWPPLGQMQGWSDIAVYDLGTHRQATVTLPIPAIEVQRQVSWPVPSPYFTHAPKVVLSQRSGQ